MSRKILGLNKENSINRFIDEEEITIKEISKKDIAIIGMGVKMPEAKDINEFWMNTCTGKNHVRDMAGERLKDIENYLESVHNSSVAHRKTAYIDDIDKFDYDFFRLSPKEAQYMDPNQRLFLETAISAIEDAGYGGDMLQHSKTGVFVGFSSPNPGYKNAVNSVEPAAATMLQTGNIPSMLASRISYYLDLTGPSIIVDTACSSSLVAIHLACKAIRDGECEMAIAGSSKIILLTQKNGTSLGIESADGFTRAFDDSSDGTGAGEGVAAILLKPLSKAIEDRDHIYAIVKGGAYNQDGKSAGITAPNPLAQEEVIVSAWKDAQIDPETIAYIEAHGTGTKLGDPIEVEGITKAFRRYTNKKQFCALASVKSNVGHLDNASGIAGVIKAALALKNKQIPATLFFNKPNRKINFEESPVYINNRLSQWENKGYPRRCGVSSFGISGTNCHIVLEEAPSNDIILSESTSNVVTISAKSKESLHDIIGQYIHYINTNAGLFLCNIAYTTSTGRGHYKYRVVAMPDTIDELKALLESFLNGGIQSNKLFYGEHTVSNNDRKHKEAGVITAEYKHLLTKQAFEITNNIKDFHNKSLDKLQALCDLYIKGADIEWRALFHKGEAQRVSLPTYQFKRSRCWFQVEKSYEKDMYYTTQWVCEDLLNRKEAIHTSNLLLFVDETGIGKEIAAKLEAKGANVILVDLGHEYRKINDKQYEIQGVELDYYQLLKDIRQTEALHIIHLMSITTQKAITDLEYIKKRQEFGVYSIFYLTKALREYTTEVKLSIVTQLLNAVTGDEKTLNIFNATMLGLAKVIQKENAYIKCKVIDIDDDYQVDDIAQELKEDTPALHIAYRKGKRYVEELCKAYPKNQGAGTKIRDKGVYIVTGGTSGIGAKIAKHIAIHKKAILILIGKTILPARGIGNELLESAENSRIGNKIRLLHELEELGAEVVYYAVDISSSDDVRVLIQQIKDKYGCINGIIHSAGLGSKGYLLDKEKESFELVLQPKVYGAWNLYEHTKNEPLDFFVMFSAITSIFGSAGLSDYTAANAFLDSFAAYLNRNGIPALAINWSTWKDTGMAIEYNVNKDGLCKLLSEEIGLEAFEVVLNSDLHQVAIGSINFQNPNLGNVEKEYWIRFGADIKAELEKINNNNKDIQLQKDWNNFNPFSMVNTKNYSDKAKKNGSYIIMDGFTDLGVMFANYLVNSLKAHVAILGTVEACGSIDIEKDMGQLVDYNTFAKELNSIDLNQRRKMDLVADQLCSSYIYEYFKKGIPFIELGACYRKEDLKEALRIIPEFDKFFELFLKVLKDDGMISVKNEVVTFLVKDNEVKASYMIRKEMEEDLSQFQGILHLLEHCVVHYPQALSGDISPISVLYPDGESNLMEESYKGSSNYSNKGIYIRLLGQLVIELAKKNGEKPIRILEVGGGNGVFTRTIIDELNNYNVEYYFTDLGRTFVNREKIIAEEKNYKFMKFDVLDISKDPIAQGFEPHSFDIVIGVDVIHATRNIGETLDCIKLLLNWNGICLILEQVKQCRWIDMIWGLAEGWWHFNDTEHRMLSPLLSMRKWRDILTEHGFERLITYPTKAEEVEMDYGLIVAQMDHSQALNSMDYQFMTRLNELQTMKNAEIINTSQLTKEKFASLKQRLTKEYGSVNGVIDLNKFWESGCINIQTMIEQSEIKGMEEDHLDARSNRADVRLIGYDKEAFTEVERQVASIWADMLGLEEIHIDDNFYEIGGDSLIAMHIVNHINMLYKIQLQVPELFAHLTIRELSDYLIEKHLEKEKRSTLYSSIEPAKEQNYYELASAQKRIFVLEQYRNIGTCYNIPQVIRIEGKLDVNRLETAFHKLLQRHDSLRTSFEFIEDKPVQIIHKKANVSIDVYQAQEAEMDSLVRQFIKPFHLEQAPLLRVCLIKINDERHYLLFDIHHIIADGTSITILIKEFVDLYEGKRNAGFKNSVQRLFYMAKQTDE